MGVTQQQLGDRLGVDQATVSRWERGVESPRPARQKALRKLLVREEERRFVDRSIAIVRNDLMVSTLMDARLRMTEFSASSESFFRKRGRDPDAIVGMCLDSYADRFGLPTMMSLLDQSGILTGEGLLFRFTVTMNGLGNTTVWEPLFHDGELQGIFNCLAAEFEVPFAEAPMIEMAECVTTADPGGVLSLYRGERADLVSSLSIRPDRPLYQ